MNRGSVQDLSARAWPVECFNEAPIHESGKCCTYGWLGEMLARFNEAPIHESGKFRPAASMSGKVRSFNEAPIHESGKLASRPRAR